MTKAEVIKSLNENAEWIKGDIEKLEKQIFEKAKEMAWRDVPYIMAAAQYIVRCQREIEDKQNELNEVKTRIKIVRNIEA